MPQTACKFSPGSLRATPAALQAIQDAGQEPLFFLSRHARGDWLANDHALQDGSRLLPAYRTLEGVRLGIVTEAEDSAGHRAATTILLPQEHSLDAGKGLPNYFPLPDAFCSFFSRRTLVFCYDGRTYNLTPLFRR